MIGVLEIGNSNIVFALMDGERVEHKWRIESNRNRSADEYGIELARLLDEANTVCDSPEAMVIASVVPGLETTLVDAARQSCGVSVRTISWQDDLGIANRCEPPSGVGIDRLLNASAAFHRWGRSAIVVDLGTATTFDVVNERGEFLGGAIAPGLRTAADALTANAPRLGTVELAPPPAAIANNTVHALQSGIVLGYASMVDGMITRMRDELGSPALTVATGGLAGIIAPLCQRIDRCEPDLTLTGIAMAYERTKLAAQRPLEEQMPTA